MSPANFLAFLKEIGIVPVPTEMTFGVSRDQGLFEWAGTSLSAVFAQRKNLLQPRMWRMIFDIIRFNQYALDLLSSEEESEVDPSGANGSTPEIYKVPHQQSIGDYLDHGNYSDAFRNDYLIPMTAAVWSTSPDKAALEFPAVTLVRFLWNHHLLSTIAARPSWLTIKNGSQQYIDAVMQDFPKERVHLSTPIESLRTQENDQVVLLRNDGNEDVYDHVILATHGDQALQIIRPTATAEESAILSGFKTSTNTASLHSDLSVSPLHPSSSTPIFSSKLTFPLPPGAKKLMPTLPQTWSSWNYITTTPTQTSTPTVCLTYNMNILQHIPLPKYGPVLVTLNPLQPPAPSLTQGAWSYNHPLYNKQAIHSQRLLPLIQNTRKISYAGAWTKYGFHEDGFSSGLKVAVEHLGAELPFAFADSTFARGRRPVLGWTDWVVRGFVSVGLVVGWGLGWLGWVLGMVGLVLGWVLGVLVSGRVGYGPVDRGRKEL